MSNLLKEIFSLEWLKTDFIRKNYKFLLFLLFLGFVYLINSLFLESKIQEVNNLEKSVKKLRNRYLDIEKDLMIMRRQDKVLEKLKEMGSDLQLPGKPPEIILIDTTKK